MKKDVGAILLVAGTTIGAGMLALPAITNPLGFFLSQITYFAVFLMMLKSAKYLVKTTLFFEKPHNFVELAEKTLGIKGKAFCWFIYLLLMYALLAAYISASSSMLSSVLVKNNLIISESILFLLLPISFSLFITFGLKTIDIVNRLLMAGLLISFFGLCYFLMQNFEWKNFSVSNPSYLKAALPIIITSFGYHIIIPTLSSYLNRDEKRINRALLYGSLIPLLIYVFWHILIYFNLSDAQLTNCLTSDIPITDVLALRYPIIKPIAFSFAYLAILTSFIGVALSLFDFLKDSLPKHALFKNRKILFSITFLPPLIYIFYFKKAFYLALDHAGILVSILLIILPSIMFIKIYPKKRLGPSILIVLGFTVIIMDIFQKAFLS